MISIKFLDLNNRNNSLNLFRLIFATFVLIKHSFVVFAADINSYMPNSIVVVMSFAVPFFFYISGYLITASAIKNDFKTFLKKRLARIYPAYFICILLIVILFAPLAFTIINGNFDLLSYLNLNPSPARFFIYALPLNLFENNIGTLLEAINADNWNVSIWTLIFEFGCYIAVSIVMAVLMKSRIRKNHYPKALFAIYLILGIAYTLMPDSSSKALTYFKLGLYLFSMFFAGGFVYLIKDKLAFSYKLFALALIYCTVCMALFSRNAAGIYIAIPMTYILLVLSVKIKSPGFIKENDISYGTYIYAWPVQCLIAILITFNNLNVSVWQYLLYVWILTTFFAVMSWFVVEKPILKKVR